MASCSWCCSISFSSSKLASSVAMITRKRAADPKRAASPAWGGGGAKHHFVLVHGLGHGAWCWYKVQDLLEGAGHRVTCLDLACSGVDVTDPATVLSFADYDRSLMDFMSNLPEGDKVVLVGHSAGGLSVSHAMHRFSGKISTAVFVAANMLRSGISSVEELKAISPDVSKYGKVEDMRGPNGVLKKEFQRKLLYNLSPLQDQILASTLLRPSPLRTLLLSAKFDGDEEAVDAVPRVFVRTTQDRIINPEIQSWLVEAWPPAAVYTLESDHSPFFSAPTQLLDALLRGVLPLAADE